MTVTFIATLTQVLMMFTFMLVGYLMNKFKFGGENASGVLSSVVVNIFMPAMVYSAMADNFHTDTLSENSMFFIMGCIIIAVSFILAKLLARIFGKNALQRDIYMYSFLIPNIGYMGYPLIEAVFGAEALFKMMVLVIPFNIVIYTYGLYILNPNRNFSIKKILNPSMIALALGIIAGLVKFKLPGFLDTAVDSAKVCMSPCAMLLTGYVLAQVQIKDLLKDLRLYLAALVRALLIPGLAFLFMHLCDVENEIILLATATLAMPMGLNSVVFPEAYGGDGITGAKTTFVSNVISIITIPFVFAFLQAFIG